MEGKVNACTKARLCIGIKDVQPRLPRYLLPPRLYVYVYVCVFFSSTLLLLLVYRQHSLWRGCILSREWTIGQKEPATAREAIQRQYLTRSDDSRHTGATKRASCLTGKRVPRPVLVDQ